jgi:outer membrane protein with beta-barrel domain
VVPRGQELLERAKERRIVGRGLEGLQLMCQSLRRVHHLDYEFTAYCGGRRMRLIAARHLFGIAAVLLLAPTVSRSAAAQRTALAVVGGAWEYDLSGTGTSGFGGLRLEMPVGRLLVVEPGLTYARYSPQFGGHVNYLIPELQVQVQVPGRVSPFLGGGLGLSYAWASGAHATDLSLSGSVGTRVRLTELWGARAEFRARSIDPFHNTIVEWTLGISRRL